MFKKIHPSIRNALFVFCAVFILSLSSVALSYVYLDKVGDEERKANIKSKQWKQKIEEAKENNKLFIEYEKPYIELVDNNIIGDENRLSWFESLQATSESRGLGSITFSMASQVELKDKKLKKELKGLKVFQSVMTLDMDISHEGDLFAVFNNLDSVAKGLYSVNKCNVESTRRKQDDSRNLDIAMKASCEISWHTIRTKLK